MELGYPHQHKKLPIPIYCAILTFAAVVPATLFWTCIIDLSTHERFSSDRMIAMGMAAYAISIAWLLAAVALSLIAANFAVAHRPSCIGLGVINTLILLSPLVYWV